MIYTLIYRNEDEMMTITYYGVFSSIENTKQRIQQLIAEDKNDDIQETNFIILQPFKIKWDT